MTSGRREEEEEEEDEDEEEEEEGVDTTLKTKKTHINVGNKDANPLKVPGIVSKKQPKQEFTHLK